MQAPPWSSMSIIVIANEVHIAQMVYKEKNVRNEYLWSTLRAWGKIKIRP